MSEEQQAEYEVYRTGLAQLAYDGKATKQSMKRFDPLNEPRHTQYLLSALAKVDNVNIVVYPDETAEVSIGGDFECRGTDLACALTQSGIQYLKTLCYGE